MPVSPAAVTSQTARSASRSLDRYGRYPAWSGICLAGAKTRNSGHNVPVNGSGFLSVCSRGRRTVYCRGFTGKGWRRRGFVRFRRIYLPRPWRRREVAGCGLRVLTICISEVSLYSDLSGIFREQVLLSRRSNSGPTQPLTRTNCLFGCILHATSESTPASFSLQRPSCQWSGHCCRREHGKFSARTQRPLLRLDLGSC